MSSRFDHHEPKRAAIACHTSGDNTLVAGVAGKQILVLELFVVVATAANVYFHDNSDTPVMLVGDGTDKLALAANSGFHVQSELGLPPTTKGKGFVMNLDGAISSAGYLTYLEI
jgi:hypothetical protein